MPRVVISPQAQADLDDIYDFIGRERHSPQAADHILGKVDEKSQLYAGQPELGEARPDLGVGLRIFLVSRYVVAYFPIDDGIEVVRVVDGARDFGSLF